MLLLQNAVNAASDCCLHAWCSADAMCCRHKPLKPPGAKRAPNTRARQPLSEEAKAQQAEQKADRLAQLAVPGEAPTLRHSTRIRVEEAQQVRQRAEKVHSPLMPFDWLQCDVAVCYFSIPSNVILMQAPPNHHSA